MSDAPPEGCTFTLAEVTDLMAAAHAAGSRWAMDIGRGPSRVRAVQQLLAKHQRGEPLLDDIPRKGSA